MGGFCGVRDSRKDGGLWMIAGDDSGDKQQQPSGVFLFRLLDATTSLVSGTQYAQEHDGC